MEEDSYIEDEDEIDEEMEAMLYSQVHYELDSSVGQEMATAQKYLNPESQHIFTVTPLKEGLSSMSLKHSVISAAASVSRVKQQPLVESAFSDSEDSTEVGKSFDKARNVVADTRIDSVVQTDSSVLGQTADAICTDSPKGTSDDQHQVRFDMEAELGINVPPKAKKGNKTKNNEDTSVHTANTSKPKFSGTDATFSTPEFIKIDKRAPQTEQDYRKTLNRLLTSHSRSKKVKDIVVVQSDSASSSSSSSSNLSDDDTESGNSDPSSESSSESDVGIIGSIPADESAEVLTLDLNWNISADDRETVERIEKGASQVDESKWKINDEDLILGGPMVSRYYSKKQVRCHNCDKEGHLSKVCPEARKRPVCGLCGTEGHIMKRCKNNLCFNCNQPGHRGRACPQPKRKCFARCSRCHFKGHEEKHCPDLWRQYHLTITSSEDLTLSLREVNPRRFCCNCAKPGHFAHECRNARMDNYNFPASPFVIRYDVLPNEPRKDNEQGSGRKFKSQKRKGSPSLTKQGDSVDSPPSSKKPYRLGSKDKGPKQKAKDFKSDHPHSRTFRQSEGIKMYPRGSQNSFSDPGSQQFSAQTSTLSSPYEHTPSGSNMNSSLEKGAQEVHTTKTYPYQQGGTPGRPAYSKTFGQPMLPKEDSRNIDHQSKQRHMDDYSDSHKKKNARRRRYRNKKRLERFYRTTDGGTVGNLPLSETFSDQRTGDKPREKSDQDQMEGWKKPRKQMRETKGESTHQHHAFKTHDSDSQRAKKQWKQKQRKESKAPVSQSSTSAKGMESLTITCRNGFRTTVRTMNFNRDCRNALH